MNTANSESAPHENPADNTGAPTDTFTMGGAKPDGTDTTGTGTPWQDAQPKPGFFDRLRASTWKRVETNKVAGGVCTGLAEKMGIDPVIVRGIAVVLMLFTGIGMLAYGLAWLLLPEKTTGRTLLEDAKYGQAQPLMAFPILLTVLGFFRIFPEINVVAQPFGIASLAGAFGGFGWLSRLGDYSEPGMLSFAGGLLAFAAASIIVIGATIWICVLLYRRKYSQAWTIGLIVGFGSLLGTIAEVILLNSLGNFPAFPLFIATFMGVMAISPISIPAFIICGAVGSSRQKTPPYQSGYVPPASTTPADSSTPAGYSPTKTPFAGGSSPFSNTPGSPGGTSPAASSQPSSPYASYVAGIHEAPAPSAAQPEYAAPKTTQSAYTPSIPLPMSALPKPPRVAGPSRAFSLTVIGLVLLAVFGVNLLRYFQVFSFLEQYWLLGTGAVAVILAGGMLVLTLRHRRTSWLSWATPLMVFLAVVPSLVVAEVAPEVRDVTKNWSWNSLTQALDDETQELDPGNSGQSISGDFDIDLRGKPLANPIEVQSVSGNTNIYLNPDQPVRLNLGLVTGEIRLSAMNQWSEKTHPSRKGFLRGARTETDRPQYFSADGTQRVLFTDRALAVESKSVNLGLVRKPKMEKPFILENAAAKKTTTHQEIRVSCVSCIIAIYERPSEVLWNGTVLPDGHFLVNYWLDEKSVRQALEVYSPLPEALASRVVAPGAILAGKPVEDVAAASSSRLLTLTDIQNGTLGQWTDANNDGFNDAYQPGGAAWKPGDTLYNPETGKPLPYLSQSQDKDSARSKTKTDPDRDSESSDDDEDTSDDEDNEYEDQDGGIHS